MACSDRRRRFPFSRTSFMRSFRFLFACAALAVVSRDSGIKSVSDLIARAKQQPGTLNFASAGTGSGTHINAEKFRLAAGVEVVHVPYKGTPEALTDTIAGRVTYFFSPISAALP